MTLLLLNPPTILSSFPGRTSLCIQISSSSHHDPKKGVFNKRQKWIAFCFPPAFAYYSISKWKWVWFTGVFISGLEAIKEVNFQSVRRHLISLYIHHNTLHRCLNCPLSAQNERNPILSAVCSPSISVFPSLTHTHTPPDSNYRAADVGLSGEQLMHTYTFLHLYTIKDCQIRI